MAAKKKTTAKRASTKKGKRYSTAQKRKVLAFVDKVNSSKGRGGMTAAAKKFGVTPLTISNWMKKDGGTSATSKTKPGRKAVSNKTGILKEMLSLEQDIAKLESALAAKRSAFDALKGKL